MMKKYVILFLITQLVACGPQNLKLDKQTTITNKKKKLLMIGNSFTFYWNLPQILEMMFEYNGFDISVDQKTIGGTNLKNHWNNHLFNDYNFDRYDYVVLNEYSTYPLLKTDTAAKYFKLFNELAKNNNTKTYVYGTWEYPYLKKLSTNKNSNTMLKLDSIANLLKATYVPVGDAISIIEEKHPEFDLYMDDEKHPSPNTSYLIACIFYSMITGESPIGLPVRFQGKNIEGKKIYYVITEPKCVEISQSIANYITMDKRKN